MQTPHNILRVISGVFLSKINPTYTYELNSSSEVKHIPALIQEYHPLFVDLF